jgi:hypothetical protein
MALLGKLVMSATLDYDKVTKGTQNINKSLGTVEKKMSALNGKMKAAFSVGAVVAFGAKLKSTFENLDGIVKLSDQLGIAAEDLQKLRFAGEQTGVATGTVDRSIEKFTKRLGEAKQKGTGPLSDALDSLGISLENADGTAKSSMDVMMEYGEAMSNAADPATKMFLATEAFGRSGGGMINTFAGGSEAVKAFGDELAAAGGIISESALRDVERANDAMNLLSHSWEGASASIMVKLAPAIELLAGWLTKLPDHYEAVIRWTTDLIEAIVNIPEKIRQGLSDAADAVKEKTEQIKDSVKDMATGAVDSVVEMGSDLKKNLNGKLSSIADGATSILDGLDGSFYSLWNNVTKNSYMPDMVDDIAYHFGRLDKVMVKPSEDAINEVDELFEGLQSSITGSFEGLFNDIFSGEGVDAFKNFAKDVMSIFTSLISEMAAKWVSAKIFGGTSGVSGIAESFVGKGGIGKFISGGGIGGGVGGGIGGIGGGISGIGGIGTTISKSIMKGFKALKGFFSGGGSFGSAAMGGGPASMAGGGMGGFGGIAGAAIPLAIGAFGFAKLAANAKKKREANQRYSAMGDGQFDQLNPSAAFNGLDETTGKFFVSMNEGWKSTINALKEANALIDHQGALYDSAGNEMYELSGNVGQVKTALANATVTGFEFGAALEGAIEKSSTLGVKVQGDAETIKTALQAATAIGIGGFRDLKTTATGVSATLTGDFAKWDTFLQQFVNNSIGSAVNGISALGDEARGTTSQFLAMASAARSIPMMGGGDSGMQKFASGGVSHRAAIFGEAGPEAAVPLPDGRTIPVTISGGGSDNTETNMLLKKLIRATERASLTAEGYSRK